MEEHPATRPVPQIQPCRYKVGKTLGAGSYSVVKECVHIDTGRYYAAKVINKRLMAGREHMVRVLRILLSGIWCQRPLTIWPSRFEMRLPCSRRSRWATEIFLLSSTTLKP